MKHGLDILMIDQPNGGRDDRVSEQLSQRGYNLIWVRPAAGEPLPDVGEIDACVSFGGSGSANDTDRAMLETLRWTEAFVATGKPFFGICLGAQILAKALGARVYSCEIERGFTEIHPSNGGNDYLARSTRFYQWHKETFDMPRVADPLGYGDVVENQAFSLAKNQIAVQFHPDVRYQTCARWLNGQRDLWPKNLIGIMEGHLPLFKRHDAIVDAWVSDILDGWDEELIHARWNVSGGELNARRLQG